jgi:phenylalanine-4-hydroxylase
MTFFAHLAGRCFPSTCFIRRRDQLDYIQEPDVFHDICGHVPLLMNPVSPTTRKPMARVG